MRQCLKEPMEEVEAFQRDSPASCVGKTLTKRQREWTKRRRTNGKYLEDFEYISIRQWCVIRGSGFDNNVIKVTKASNGCKFCIANTCVFPKGSEYFLDSILHDLNRKEYLCLRL